VIASKTNKFFLVKPTSGMNRSGSAVKQIIDSKKLLAEQICIIVDDVDLPLGKIRIKPKGGDGSHRGLENIIYTLRTDRFPRLRYGIGTDEQMRPAENYVLKPFKNEKEKSYSIETIKKAADALDSFIFNGLNKTMNIYNS
jgi:PTH1 family peptidyl-tRNA hydrolase